MNSIDDCDASGREMGSRSALSGGTENWGKLRGGIGSGSARRTSVRIWLRQTRPACVARKNSSFSLMIWDEEWKAAAIAVRSMVVIAREIMTSGGLSPRRRGAVTGRPAAGRRLLRYVHVTVIIGAPRRSWRRG